MIGRAAVLKCDEPAEPAAEETAPELLLDALFATRATPARELPPDVIPAERVPKSR